MAGQAKIEEIKVVKYVVGSDSTADADDNKKKTNKNGGSGSTD